MATHENLSVDADCYEYLFVCSICSEVSTDAVCKNDHSSYKTSNKRCRPADSPNIDYENLINTSIVSTSAQEQSHAEKVRKQRAVEDKLNAKTAPTNSKSTLIQRSRKVVKPLQQTYVCPECGDVSAESTCKNDHAIDVPKDVCDRCNASFDSVEELIGHREDPTKSCLPPLQHIFVPFRDVRIVTVADSKHIFYDLGQPIVLSLPDNFASMVQKGTLGMGQYQVVAAFPDVNSKSINKAEIIEKDHTENVTILNQEDPMVEIPLSHEATSTAEIQASKTTEVTAETNVATTQTVVPRTYPHCVVCQEDFRSIDSLITHCVSHGEPLDFQCQFCLRHYNTAYWFKTHLKTHVRQLPLVCQLCDAPFLTAEQRKDHLQNVHDLKGPAVEQLQGSYSEHQENQFKCMACGRWFKSQWHLELHSEVSHAGKEATSSTNAVSNGKETAVENPTEATDNQSGTSSAPPTTSKKAASKKPIHVFECNICSATIRSIDEVRRHLSQHARSRLYKCEACNRRFLSPKELQKHKCTATAATATTTTKRADIHRCSKCEKVFNHAAGLACHLKTHSDDRSEGYSCEKCTLKFKILSSYLIHRSQAH